MLNWASDVSRGFVFYFVTCPCSSRTKRHDNLFVVDDDDDDDDEQK